MTRDDVLNAVLDAPDDDAPRLAYARELSEAGDPLGEYIEAEINAARLAKGDPERITLERKARQLRGAYGEHWKKPFHDLGVVAFTSEGHLLTERGFFNSLVIPAEKFLENQDKLFAMAPIQSLTLTGLTSEQAVRLARSPHLRRLTHLELRRNKVGDDGLKALVDSPHLTNLARLDLRDNGIGREGLEALSRSEVIIQLTDLNLSGNPLGDRATADFVRSLPIPNALRTLHLGDTLIGDGVVTAIADSAALSGITRLDLGFNEIGDDGAKKLAQSTGLVGLKELNIEENNLTDEGTAAIVGSDALPHDMKVEILHTGARDIIPGAAQRAVSNNSAGRSR